MWVCRLYDLSTHRILLCDDQRRFIMSALLEDLIVCASIIVCKCVADVSVC